MYIIRSVICIVTKTDEMHFFILLVISSFTTKTPISNVVEAKKASAKLIKAIEERYNRWVERREYIDYR